MASRVDFAVSATPVYTHAAGEGASVDSIAADVGKSLGGSGSVAAAWGTTVGYGNVTAGVADRVASGTTYAIGEDSVTLGVFPASVAFIFIKHSGFLWDASATDKLGAVTLLDVRITNGAAGAISDANTVCVLGPGDAIVLPFASDDTVPVLNSGGNGAAIAMEIMAVPRS